MPSSQMSDVSIDQGFADREVIPRGQPVEIDDRDRREFQEQYQTQRKKQRIDIEEQRQVEGQEAADLERRLNE
jgi:hypothetical protein